MRGSLKTNSVQRGALNRAFMLLWYTCQLHFSFLFFLVFSTSVGRAKGGQTVKQFAQ